MCVTGLPLMMYWLLSAFEAGFWVRWRWLTPLFGQALQLNDNKKISFKNWRGFFFGFSFYYTVPKFYTEAKVKYDRKNIVSKFEAKIVSKSALVVAVGESALIWMHCNRLLVEQHNRGRMTVSREQFIHMHLRIFKDNIKDIFAIIKKPIYVKMPWNFAECQ